MKKGYLRALSFVIILAMSVALGTACAKKNNGNASLDNSGEKNTYDALKDLSFEETTRAHIEEKTEAVTEAPTEKITEKAPEPVVQKTLKFTSFGNGTCAVSGIGSCDDLCIVIPERSPDGDVVTSIEDMAFYGNDEIKTVQIPSTVSRIGSRAFGGCTSLVYISADSQNKSFCDVDGVLYSADMTSIIHYPASSAASSINIPQSVKRVEDMAFYDCTALKTICFEGALSDWGKIDIGELNYGLFTASISCTGSGK